MKLLNPIIFLFFLLTSCYSLQINERKIVVFYTKTQPFLINNIRYRESINDKFTLQLESGRYNISNNNYNLYDGNIRYSKPYFKNIVLKPNITETISSVYSYNVDNQFIYLSADITTNKKQKIKFEIIHNSNVIYSIYSNKLSYLNSVKAYPGLNSFFILATSNDYTCICPSMNKGFTQNYQMAIWNETLNNNIEVIDSIKSKNHITTINYIVANLTLNDQSSDFFGFIK